MTTGVRNFSFCILNFAFCIFFFTCRGEQSAAKPPVVLISIDTLRSDHLPVYGYRDVETPNIDALRADSLLFANAYAHVPLTLPSHATMLTGRLPADNGIRDNIGFRLRSDVPTLPELLKRTGYATGAAVSSFVLRQESGLGRGFDFYDDSIELDTELQNLGALQRSGSDTVRIAEKWISSAGGKPFFFMLHLYEPHTPYEPPEPYRSRYASRPYDGEIAASDQIVGEFVEFLKRSDIYDGALIILLSDHGEGLSDHGEDEHGVFLYREAIQVPLLVKLPSSRRGGETVEQPVQLADVFTTIADQAGSQYDRTAMAGRSLLNETELANRRIFSESYYARIHFGWSELHSIIDGPHHYIHAPQPELYNLQRDPGERTNIVASERRIFAALRRVVEPLIREPAAQEAVNPEEARKLAALGYLGSIAQSARSGERPDPKSKTETLQAIKRAFGFFREERDVEAVAHFRALLRENPGMLDIWDALARSLIRLHRYEEAISAAKEALKISPQTPHFAALVANASLELKQFEDAAKHAELLLDDEPAQAREILARVELGRKNYDEAKRQAELALATKRDRLSTLLTLARIENERNNAAAALQLCEQISAILREKKIDKIRRLHFNRGDALARMGRYREAEGEFREEIRSFPQDPQAYKNLILLYVTQERLDDATGVIFELERTAPTPPAYAAIAETLKFVGDPQGARYWARRGLDRFPDDPRLRSLASS